MSNVSFTNRLVEKVLGLCTTRRLVSMCLIMTAVIMLIQLATLTKYPHIFIDEPWFSNAAWTWLTTGVNFDAIHAGVLDQFGYEWLRLTCLGELPWVASFSLFGLGFFQARLPSWILGCCLLLATYIVGTKLYSRMTGAFAVLLLCAAPAFIGASHFARQEIWLALVGMLVFGLARFALLQNRSWSHVMVGLLAGISLDVHRNGCIYILGVVMLYVVHYRWSIVRQTGAWLCLAGGIVGVGTYVAIHILPSPEAYFKLNSFLFSSNAVLPIMSGPVGIARGFVIELFRYEFHKDGLHFALITISFGLLIWRWNDRDQHLVSFTCGVLLGFALLIGNNSNLYRILSFPFFLLAVAEAFVYLISQRREWVPERVFIVSLAVLLAAYYPLINLYDIKESVRYDQNRISQQVVAAISADDARAPGTTRVMGVPTWWFGLADYDYRSSHSVRLYMSYNGLSLTESMDVIRPDFVIVDDELRTFLYDETSELAERETWQVPEREFNRYLTENARLLERFSDPFHGRFEVYAIEHE